MRHITRLSILLLAIAACASCKSAAPDGSAAARDRRAALDASADTQSDCDRRSRAMIEQERAMREKPDPGRWQGDDARGDAQPGSSPCDRVNEKDDAQRRRDANVRARTRAKMFLEQGSPDKAKEALQGAFERGTQGDPELRNLALDIHDALVKSAPEGSAPAACQLKDLDKMSAGALHTLEGAGRVVVVCDLPDPEDRERELRVALRERTRPGEFEEREVRELGPIHELEHPVQLVFALPLAARADAEALATAAIYYDVVITATRAGHAPDPIGRAGLFWFAR